MQRFHLRDGHFETNRNDVLYHAATCQIISAIRTLRNSQAIAPNLHIVHCSALAIVRSVSVLRVNIHAASYAKSTNSLVSSRPPGTPEIRSAGRRTPTIPDGKVR